MHGFLFHGLRGNHRFQIGFIQKHQRFLSLQKLQNLLVAVIQRSGAVCYIEDQICVLCLLSGPIHSNLLHHILGGTDPCRVQKLQRNLSQLKLLLQHIPGSSGDFCDNSPLFTQKHVQKRGFTCVGLTQNHSLNTFLQHPSTVRTLQKLFHFFLDILHLFQKLFPVTIQADMLRIIQSRFHKGHLIQNFFTQSSNLLAHCTLQLCQGRPESHLIFRLNQIHDRLCLGQIHPSVQKGPFGKLPRFCGSGAILQNRFQNLLHHQAASMTVDILRRIAVGTPHEHHQYLIQHLVSIHSHTIMNRVS